MIPFTLSSALQLVVGLGLLNVWLLRSSLATRFRGGNAQTLQQEFEAYGLPRWFYYLIGTLKLGSAFLLIGGLWIPELVLPASALVCALMLGALSMHLKVKDPLIRSLPALCMLVMGALLLGLQLK